MDCAKIEDLLFEHLEGRLEDGDARLLREHIDDCARCRELATLVGDGHDDIVGKLPADLDLLAEIEAPPDLVPGVLERTSGSPCERARLLLAAAPEERHGDALTLLSGHVASCVECSRVAGALARMELELPELAELDPGDGFTEAVLARTAAVTPTRTPSLRARLAAMWERAAQRPRFALEAAYAGAVVAFLFFGLPSATWADMPARAFEGLRQEGVKLERVVASGMEDLIQTGRTSWSTSWQQVDSYIEALEQETAEDTAAERVLRAWIGATRDLVIGVWDHVIVPLGEHLQALWRGSPTEPESSVP